MPTPDEPDVETSEPERAVDAADIAEVHSAEAVGSDTGAGEVGQADLQVELQVELDERLAELDGLSARPLLEHVEVYQRLHTGLQAALAEIDSA